MSTSSDSPTLVSPRMPGYLTTLYLLGFVACAALLGAAYYFEYFLYLDPCPLCVVQRVVTLVIGLSCLVAAISRGLLSLQLVMMGVVVITAAFGIWVADHHVFIQNLPEDQVPACGPDLAYMIETLPMNDLINRMLQGNGSCADVSWHFLSLSMPEWMRLWFVGFTLAGLACFYRIAIFLRAK